MSFEHVQVIFGKIPENWWRTGGVSGWRIGFPHGPVDQPGLLGVDFHGSWGMDGRWWVMVLHQLSSFSFHVLCNNDWHILKYCNIPGSQMKLVTVYTVRKLRIATFPKSRVVPSIFSFHSHLMGNTPLQVTPYDSGPCSNQLWNWGLNQL